MSDEQILLLGYPINKTVRTSLEESLKNLIIKYGKDHYSRFATTVNALILGQLAGVNPNHLLRLEVVSFIRYADFIGLDSLFLILTSRFLGGRVEEIVTPEDLLMAAAALAIKENFSIFLVGGHDAICQQTAQQLKVDFPHINIIGIASPSIFTKGDRIVESIERDTILVDLINSAKPDLLFLQLGHPKEEIWFERVKEDLHVPLSIGVGGAFDRYLENKGIHHPHNRFTWHKFRRRIISTFHYLCWLPPLLLFHGLNKLLTDVFFHRKAEDYQLRYLFISQKETLTILPFPKSSSHSLEDRMIEWTKEAFEHENILLDLSEVHHIDLSGLGLLYRIWKQAHRHKKNLFIYGISNDLRWLIKLHGAWDYIAPHLCQTPLEVLDRMSLTQGVSLSEERDFFSIQQIRDSTLLSVFGILHGINARPNSLTQLEPILKECPCIVNLKYCSSISNRGLGYLIKLKQILASQQQKLYLQNISKDVLHQLKLAKLKSFFHYI